jgi:hypothetical protein
MLLRALVLLTVFLPSAGVCQGTPGQQTRWVTLEKEAVLAMPPDLAAAPTVEKVSLSPRGRYLMAVRTAVRLQVQKVQTEQNVKPAEVPIPKSSETCLIWWDNQLRESREIWRTNQPQVKITQLLWLGRTDSGAAVLQNLSPQPGQPRFGLLRVGPAQTRAQVVSLPETVSRVEGFAPTHQPEAALLLWMSPPGGRPDASTCTLWLLREGAAAPKSIQIPATVMPVDVIWNGDQVLLRGVSADGKGKGIQHFTIHPATGALNSIPPPPPPAAMEPKVSDTAGGLSVSVERQTGAESSVTPRKLVLYGKKGSENPSAVLSFDTTGGTLHPDGRSLFYQSQGALFAVELLRTDKAAFLAAREAAERAVLMSNAKQVALAALMYAADHDETLPGADGVEDKLAPYLKDTGLMKGMVFTFAGGRLQDISSPATTEMGHIPGPGGKAVFYADGHVKWLRGN